MLSYSAHNEDNKVIKVLKIIGREKLNYECCEFGAWDGKHLSNTYKIIKKKKYKALLIESDRKRFCELKLNLPEDRVVKINTFINTTGKNSLDFIIKKEKFNKNIDFLSIDIDGNDFHIFKNLKFVKPKIICIEYNKTMPLDFDYVQKNDFKIKQGSSAKSIIKLAFQKGYFFYDCTPDNLIFIDNKFKKKFIRYLKKNNPVLKLKKIIKFTTIAYGFDNSIIANRPLNLFWHRKNYQSLPIKLAMLPDYLIRFHEDYNVVQKILLYLIMFFRYPEKYISKPYKYLKILFTK